MRTVSLKRFATLSLLVGLVFLLGLTPIGLIHVGVIYVTLLCIPVIVGTLLMGLPAGVLLGFTFGTVSTIVLFTRPSQLAGNLLGANAALAVIMCYAGRLLLPVVVHMTARALSHRSGRLSYAAAAVAGSLTNTFVYLGLMLLFYAVSGLDARAIAPVVGSIVLLGGIPEAVAAAIVVPPVAGALKQSKLMA